MLFISAMLVVVPGSILGVLAERGGRASLQRVIGRELAREAGHVADRMEASIRVQREALASLSRQEVMREIHVEDLDKRIALALRTVPSGGASQSEHLVVDRGGQVVAATRVDWWQAPPAWAKPPYADAAATTVLANDPAGEGLLFSTPIADPDSPTHRLGTLVSLVDWSLLTSIGDSVARELEARGLAAEIAILAPDGRLLRRSHASGLPPSDPAILGRMAIREAASPDFEVVAESGLIAGRARIEAGGESWSLLVVEPLATALAPALQLRNRLLVTVALALAVALAFAAFGSRRVLRPLQELTLAIGAVAKGDRSRIAVPVRSDDEVGLLAESFNAMIRDLDTAQRHLLEAEKFALVGELAAGVAHQVRTSLGVLGSAAQILGRSAAVETDPASKEMIEMIRAEVVRLGRVVDDLLTLDHRRPLDWQSIPLSIPLRSAIEFVAPQAREKGVSLALIEPDPVPRVVCDREAIEQVCVNLLANAIAALDAGQSIEARIEPPQAGMAVFTVSDDGRGVPAEIRDRIFDPFVTGRSKGVGLGLTFVKRVIHAHHGTVTLVDGRPRGACFRVALPIATEKA